MTTHEKYLARIIFKLRIHELNGNAFEDFFVKIMSLYAKKFRPVKPHGNKGDRKNDGFDSESGKFFQVYSPESLNSSPIPNSNAISKLNEDFEGLKKYWSEFSEVKEYFFVINDKYKGVYPELEKEVAILARSNEGIKIDLFLASNLEQIFFELDDDSIFNVIGLLPDISSIKLNYAVLNEVIAFLTNNAAVKYGENLVAPDFDKKIVFNGLSESVATLLKKGSYHVGSLDKYFSSGKSSSRQLLREIFKGLYEEAKNKFDEFGKISGDMCFFNILNQATPKESVEVTNAIIILMSFYFENCDIFEEPQE